MWAQCISDWLDLIASAEARLRPNKNYCAWSYPPRLGECPYKIWWPLSQKWEGSKLLHGHFDYEFRTLYNYLSFLFLLLILGTINSNSLTETHKNTTCFLKAKSPIYSEVWPLERFFPSFFCPRRLLTKQKSNLEKNPSNQTTGKKYADSLFSYAEDDDDGAAWIGWAW